MTNPASLLLRPFDKLFVKDGRPMSLEDDTDASGLFPPPPSVVFGALRSAVLAQADAYVGSAEDPVQQGASIPGLAFAKTQGATTTLYFPAPSDLVRAKEKDDEKRKGLDGLRLAFTDDDATLTSYPLSRLLGSPLPDGQQVEGVGGYVSGAGLAAYLRGGVVPAGEIVTADALYGPEPKLGIGLAHGSGTTKDGLLYTMQMQRLCKDVRLAVRTAGFSESLPPMLRLGAESRAVEVHQHATPAWPQPEGPSGKTVTLYLATPAVFRQGWLPDFLDAQTHEGQLGDAVVRLVACSLGRYLPLGGWDIRARRPKPMRRAVPAGSVYHLEITGGTLDPEAVHGRPLHTDYPHSGRADGDPVTYQQQGFGVAYLGAGPAASPTKK